MRALDLFAGCGGASLGLHRAGLDVVAAYDACPRAMRTHLRLMPGVPIMCADLNTMGFGLSLDNFGTGHCSLSCLKMMPVDEVKIDRSLVTRMTQGREETVIVRSAIDLAHNFDRAVTAEGVETKEALELLRGMGCDGVQGFYLCEPLPFDRLAARCPAWQWRPRKRGRKRSVNEKTA